METRKNALHLTRLGINTYKEAVIYIREDCYICKAEGFEAQARIKLTIDGENFIIATLHTVKSDLLQPGQAGLSEYAWQLLNAKENDRIFISHPAPLSSFHEVRGKIFGKKFKQGVLDAIIKDVVKGRLSDIQLSAFITACAANRLDYTEIQDLTEAMVNAGDRIVWPSKIVVDKHCVGGLPGNRTTLIAVPIVAAFGLTIPKTSSRAITSSAGTADTMETLAPVDLNFEQMQNVVNQEQGCIVWGGAVSLSPADDILIRVERVLNLDSQEQMIASVLSKKIAAGSTHVIIDVPIGSTSKVRSQAEADDLKHALEQVAKNLGLEARVVFTEGIQPVGCGIGPALEARDVLAVLQCQRHAPQDLRERSLFLAGKILEFSPDIPEGEGQSVAVQILDEGLAWKKFQEICSAQGGMRIPPKAEHTCPYLADRDGKVTGIDNRRIAKLAKLAGAPRSKAAGVDLHVKIGANIEVGQPLFTIHADTQGELNYALGFLKIDGSIIKMGEIT